MLSPTLRGAVANHNYGYTLENVNFFACDDEREFARFTVAVASCLNMCVFGKAENIVTAGSSAHSLFIIVKGVVGQGLGVVLGTGKHFGSEMLMRNGKFMNDAKSVTFVSLHTLSKKDLLAVLLAGKYPKIWHSIRRFIIRMALRRVVRAILFLRRSTGTFKVRKHSRAEFMKERERLITFGRAKTQRRNHNLAKLKALTKVGTTMGAFGTPKFTFPSNLKAEMHKPPVSLFEGELQQALALAETGKFEGSHTAALEAHITAQMNYSLNDETDVASVGVTHHLGGGVAAALPGVDTPVRSSADSKSDRNLATQTQALRKTADEHTAQLARVTSMLESMMANAAQSKSESHALPTGADRERRDSSASFEA